MNSCLGKQSSKPLAFLINQSKNPQDSWEATEGSRSGSQPHHTITDYSGSPPVNSELLEGMISRNNEKSEVIF